MLVDILVLVCLGLTALILMVGGFLQKDEEIESSIRVLQVASIPAVLSVLLSWLGTLI